jgi:hypothetical protein
MKRCVTYTVERTDTALSYGPTTHLKALAD